MPTASTTPAAAYSTPASGANGAPAAIVLHQMGDEVAHNENMQRLQQSIIAGGPALVERSFQSVVQEAQPCMVCGGAPREAHHIDSATLYGGIGVVLLCCLVVGWFWTHGQSAEASDYIRKNSVDGTK